MEGVVHEEGVKHLSILSVVVWNSIISHSSKWENMLFLNQSIYDSLQYFLVDCLKIYPKVRIELSLRYDGFTLKADAEFFKFMPFKFSNEIRVQLSR